MKRCHCPQCRRRGLLGEVVAWVVLALVWAGVLAEAWARY